MEYPLMPKSTALWLIENTILTFEQIAVFCGLHPLEVQGIADGDVATGIAARNPIDNGELDQSEIERCQADPEARLQKKEPLLPDEEGRTRGPRYTPVSKRQDRPDAIAWLLKNHSELSDPQIGKLVGTTKDTINKIRNREHWNMASISPQDPVLLDLCTRAELAAALEKAHRDGRMPIGEPETVETPQKTGGMFADIPRAMPETKPAPLPGAAAPPTQENSDEAAAAEATRAAEAAFAPSPDQKSET